MLGETIRSCRKAKGISQKQLAEKADLHHNYVGELEHGEKAATVVTFLKIANGLGVHAGEFLRGL